MIIEKTSSGDTNRRQSEDHLERTRLHVLLKDAINFPLVIVCAGSGYGKTQVVHSFLKGLEAHTLWYQVSELDNNTARFWENYTSIVSLSWPEIGAQQREISFPKTKETFKKFNTLRNKVCTNPGKQIRVYDDFHLLDNNTILRFFERLVSSSPPNMTTILISRTMPDINLIGMIMREQVYTMHEEALCFSEDEIGKYFAQLKLSVTSADIRDIYNDTHGWAFAINLIGRSLAKKRKYERYALEAMKKNIFRFIEAEVSQTISAALLCFLGRVSLVDHFAASLIKELALSGGDSIIREMEAISAYIRYDYDQDMYMIHHLFRDYLRQTQEQILSDEEKNETYQIAGSWCERNGYHIDALLYYEKAGNYDAIIRMIASFNLQMTLDMARYAIGIMERIPEEDRVRQPLFPGMHIKLKINLGQFNEASILMEQYKKEYECQPETPERNQAMTILYSYYGLLRINMCTYNDVYDFDFCFKKMREYFDKNPFEIVGSYKVISMTSRATLVGTNRAGAMEEFISAVSRSTSYLSHVLTGFCSGYTELLRGELCFYRMEFNEAEQYLKQSIVKSCEHDQYVIQHRALVYLMNIDFSRGDFSSAAAKLKEMEDLLSEKDYGVRYTMYDIACAFYWMALDRSEEIPEWLKGDFSHYAHPSFLENYANRAKTRYHFKTHKYNSLLAYIEDVTEHPTILLDKIELKILQALSLYKLKRRTEAIVVFTEAYYLAESNNMIAAFVQHAKDMRTLSAAALKEKACPIPKDWLIDINNMASAFARRKSNLISEYRSVNNLEEEIELTKREIAILKDLADGLSRTEVAYSHNISINTVKTAIRIIYDKLYVTTLPEAIRTAVDRKII